MRRSVLGFCLAGLAAALLAIPAGAQQRRPSAPQISWYIFDFPPVFILSGPDTGTGNGDVWLSYFISVLPQFRHRIVTASISRMMTDIAREQGACTTSVIPNAERAKFMAFSRHFWRVQPTRVIYPEGLAPSINLYRAADGQIDVAGLARDETLQGGYIDRRSYTPAIDAAIALLKQRRGGWAVTGSEGAVEMLALGRVDYTFGYPFELRYLLHRRGNGMPLASAGAAGDPEVVEAHIACSKEAVGEALLAALDDVLDAAPPPPSTLQASYRWTRPEELSLVLSRGPGQQ
ncbi:TIGR02285 family protein [Radicibacter daui]|uniref:TIGR02285 family protein n=1 Tax=Radicibacter daui TaxID=3064829 RepID=UPI004046C652